MVLSAWKDNSPYAPDGTQNRSGHFREDKTYLALARIEPQFLGSPARSLVTVMLTKLVPVIARCKT